MTHGKCILHKNLFVALCDFFFYLKKVRYIRKLVPLNCVKIFRDHIAQQLLKTSNSLYLFLFCFFLLLSQYVTASGVVLTSLVPTRAAMPSRTQGPFCITMAVPSTRSADVVSLVGYHPKKNPHCSEVTLVGLNDTCSKLS